MASVAAVVEHLKTMSKPITSPEEIAQVSFEQWELLFSPNKFGQGPRPQWFAHNSSYS